MPSSAASWMAATGHGPGFFSWDRIDIGSALLAKHLPETLEGDVADLGAGWGFLSEQILSKCHDIKSLDCYEADKDALEATRRVCGLLPVRVRPGLRWHDVTQGVGVQKIRRGGEQSALPRRPRG